MMTKRKLILSALLISVSLLIVVTVYKPLSVQSAENLRFSQVRNVFNFGSSISGGVAPYSYSWDFGDGSFSNVLNPIHSYAKPGSYTATFTVSDSWGFKAQSVLQLAPTQCGFECGTKGFDYAIQPDYSVSPVTYYAINGLTAFSDYSGTTAETVINNAIGNLPTDQPGGSNPGTTICSTTASCNDRVIVFKGTIVLSGGAITGNQVHVVYDLRDANVTQSGTVSGNGVFTLSANYQSFVGPGNGLSGVINVGGKAQSCIYATNTNLLTINGITCTNNSGAKPGFYLSGNTQNYTITQNTVYNVGDAGIKVDSAGVATDSNNGIITSNRVYQWGSGADGIFVSCATLCTNIMIQGPNIISTPTGGSAGACINVKLISKSLIENNVLKGCRTSGVGLISVDHTLISGNEISAAGAGTASNLVNIDTGSSYNVVTNDYVIGSTDTALNIIAEVGSANHDFCSYNVGTGNTVNTVSCAGTGSSAVGNVAI